MVVTTAGVWTDAGVGDCVTTGTDVVSTDCDTGLIVKLLVTYNTPRQTIAMIASSPTMDKMLLYGSAIPIVNYMRAAYIKFCNVCFTKSYCFGGGDDGGGGEDCDDLLPRNSATAAATTRSPPTTAYRVISADCAFVVVVAVEVQYVESGIPV